MVHNGMLALLTLLACSRPAPDPVARWAADPVATKAALRREDDAQQRALAVFAILAAHPEDARALCPLLERRADRDWCSDIARRPHLWSEAPRVPLPVWSQPAPRSRFAATAPQPPAPCDRPQDVCAERQALAAAMAGAAAEAAALCASISQPRWKQECAFRTAETLAHNNRPYADIADTCLLAGPFNGSCFAHVVPALVGAQPGQAADWAHILRADAVIGAHWRLHDPALVPRFRGLFWSQLGELWLDGAVALAPRAWDDLPPEAVPHLRAAVAILAVQQAPDDLDAAAALLARWEAAPFAQTPPGARAVLTPQPVDDAPAPAPLEWVPYLNGERRLASTEPAEDRRLALLAAAARLGADAMLRQGAADESALTRAAAERLLR